MSASANSRADSAPGTPHIAGRSGDIRRERAVLIEERNHCPEGFECAAGADSELQRRIFLQAQIDRLRRMHQLDGDDPEEVVDDAPQAGYRPPRGGCCVLAVL